MPASPAPTLFDPDRTGPTVCPHCQAIRYPNQHRAITCAHDLNPETRRRPNGCLSALAREFYGDRCVLCGATRRLDVHHRTYERKGRERLSDLILLCRKCHGRFHAEAA